MENLLETIAKLVRAARLTNDEKLAMEQRLIQEMHDHPVRNPYGRGLISWSHIGNVLTKTKIKTMPAFLVILLLLGATGGTSVLAEKALPGDLLYPVKTGFNERVIDLLTLSVDAQAEVDAGIAARRLNEAEKLAEQSRLNEDTQERLIENFQEHADRVQEHALKLTANNAPKALELSAEFETSLQVHRKILSAIAEGRDATTTALLNRFLGILESEHEDTKEQEEHSQGEVDKDKSPEMKTAAEGKLKAAEHKILEVEAYLSNASSTVSVSGKLILKTEDIAEARKRLQDARDLIAKGKIAFDAGNYGEAFSLFQESMKKAQEAKLLIRAKIEFEDEDEDESRDDEDDSQTTATTSIVISPVATPPSTVTPSPRPENESENELSDREREDEPELDAGFRIRIKWDD